jgi:hypothetical protein
MLLCMTIFDLGWKFQTASRLDGAPIAGTAAQRQKATCRGKFRVCNCNLVDAEVD